MAIKFHENKTTGWLFAPIRGTEPPTPEGYYRVKPFTFAPIIEDCSARIITIDNCCPRNPKEKWWCDKYKKDTTPANCFSCQNEGLNESPGN